MINLGKPTTKQDIKTDGPKHQPAPNWLLLPVLGIYLALAFAVLRVGAAIVPVVPLALSANGMETEMRALETDNKKMKMQLKEHEKTQAYLEDKKNWMKSAVAGGDIMRKIMLALPPEVKLRGLIYRYKPEKDAGGSVYVQVQVRGTYEASSIITALERVDSDMAISSSNQDLTEEGMNIELEYQIQ